MAFYYGKCVLVTGASSGLGAAAAAALAEKGYIVWGVSRHCSREDQIIGKGMIHFLPMDVTDETQIQQVVQEICTKAGPVGIVVHCAGYGIGGAAEDTPAGEVLNLIKTDYLGVLNVNRAVLPEMRRRGGGLVIVTGSVAGLTSIPYQSQYSAAKFALEAYVQALRMESRRFGVRAVLLEPGDTKTGFTGARRLCLPEGSPYRRYCLHSVEKMERDEQRSRGPELFAHYVVRMACRKNPPLRRIVGWDYKILAFLLRHLPVGIIEKAVSRLYRA